MKKILLDTSAYSQLMRGNRKAAEYANDADIIYLSVFVLAELLTGFKGGSLGKRNLEILNNFKDKPTVQIIEATEETAEVFSEIKHKLKSAGTSIPINDLWIASNCFETGSVLITADKHFGLIQGLRLINLS